MKTYNNNDKFDQYLKETLADFKLDIPALSWEKLQLKRAELAYKKKLKKKIFFFSMAFLSLSTAITILFFNLMNNNQPRRENISVFENKAIPAKAAVKSDHKGKAAGTPLPFAKMNIPVAVNNYPARQSGNAKEMAGNESYAYKKITNDTIPAGTTYHTSSLATGSKTNISTPTAGDNKNSIAAEENKSTNAPVIEGNYAGAVTDQTGQEVPGNGMMKDKAGNMGRLKDDTIIKFIAESKKKDTFNAGSGLATAGGNKTSSSRDKNTARNEIHFSMQYEAGSTWILNQNTYGQFNGKQLAYVTTNGSSYGIMAGYDVQRRYGFQTGIIFRSAQGQKYHDKFVSGEVSREVKLIYLHIPVLYKQKRYLNNGPFPIILNFIAGLQYGRLKSATETLNGNTMNIKDHFHQNEIGFVFDVESDFYLNNSLYFTFGMNSSLSNNINSKNWPVKDNYGLSHNFLFGASLSLNYYLPSR